MDTRGKILNSDLRIAHSPHRLHRSGQPVPDETRTDEVLPTEFVGDVEEVFDTHMITPEVIEPQDSVPPA